MQAEITAVQSKVTLWGLFRRFKKKISLTLFLVVTESLLDLLFPLFIGFAINSLLAKNYTGVIALAGLGLLALLIGSGRRYYDTRAYAKIYRTLANEMAAREQGKDSPVSATAARASLLVEFVEFLENSAPSIVTSVIGLVGILVIIFTLSMPVFWAAVALFAFMGIVYSFSARKDFYLNKQYNDQLEKQWATLSEKNLGKIDAHFKQMMRWNIKMSDLETLIYGVIWIGIIGLLVYAPAAVINGGVTNYGRVFSTLMYVFQYVESVIAMPYFMQQIVRLQEISGRLSE